MVAKQAYNEYTANIRNKDAHFCHETWPEVINDLIHRSSTKSVLNDT